MTPGGFEPTIPAGGRPQTYALDRAATGTGIKTNALKNILQYRVLQKSSTIFRSLWWRIS